MLATLGEALAVLPPHALLGLLTYDATVHFHGALPLVL